MIGEYEAHTQGKICNLVQLLWYLYGQK